MASNNTNQKSKMKTQLTKHTLNVAIVFLTTSLAIVAADNRPAGRLAQPNPRTVQEVRSAIEAEQALPSNTTKVRDISGLDLTGLASRWECSVHRSTLATNEVCSNEHIYFYSLSSAKKKSIAFQFELIVGSTGSLDARNGLFQHMGTSSSMEVFPGRWKFFSEGPGDFCFLDGQRVQNIAGNPTVKGNIQFVRDNIAINIWGGGDSVNLLSVARDLDEAIKKCPLRKAADANAPNGTATGDSPAGTNLPPVSPAPSGK
jgi:hypothetical protein